MPVDMLKLRRQLAWVLATTTGVAFLFRSCHQIPNDFSTAIWESYSPSQSSSYSLDDLSNHILPTKQIIKIEIPFSSYWIAQLDGRDERQMIVPVYPASNNSHLALLFVPASGIFDLTIRIPVFEGQLLRDYEPSNCFAWNAEGPELNQVTWDRLLQDGLPKPARHMQDWCLRGQPPIDREASIWYGNGFNSPDVNRRNESLVFKTKLRFQDRQATTTNDPLHELAEFVYGSAVTQTISGGSNSLGYWFMDHTVDKTTGSLSYQPQKEHCPITFDDPGNKGGRHQSACTGQDSIPNYRFEPFRTSRKQWMMRPDDMWSCVNKIGQIRFYGDSIMWQLFRGTVCLGQGYGGMHIEPTYRMPHGIALLMDLMPFFAPREAGLPAMSDAEADRLLGVDAFPEFDPPQLEIWAFGMWYVSFAPSSEWRRGLELIYQALSRRRAQTGIKQLIALTSSPNSDPAWPTHPRWQTAGRAYRWNQVVIETAYRHNFTVVDTFWPGVHRSDARVDNCHVCDHVNIEVAMQIYQTICS